MANRCLESRSLEYAKIGAVHSAAVIARNDSRMTMTWKRLNPCKMPTNLRKYGIYAAPDLQFCKNMVHYIGFKVK
jgi:hypothetical protein